MTGLNFGTGIRLNKVKTLLFIRNLEYICRYMKKLLSLVSASIVTLMVSAQTETIDSVSPSVSPSIHGGIHKSGDTPLQLQPDSISTGSEHQRPAIDPISNNSSIIPDSAKSDAANGQLSLPRPYPRDLRPFTVSVPTDGRIFLWRNGGIFGSGRQESMPGLMAIESGSLIFVQQLGRFTFTAHGDAVKYAYFGGLQTSYGFGGSLSYQFSDRVSMTIFGSYYTPTGGMTPAMLGYTSIPNFGGYVDYNFSGRWGVKVGAQAYRSSMTNRIEAQPIVTPYYKISKHAEIGIDVGGILYNVIKNNRNRPSRINPTKPPPPPPAPPPPPKKKKKKRI